MLALSSDSPVFSLGNKTPIQAYFGAEVQDSPYTVHVGESADIKARFRNLSSSSGPYDGEATVDVTIAVVTPSGSEIRFHWNNEEFAYNPVETYQKSRYKFDQPGTYSIHAEVYGNQGEENGWVSDDRLASLTETFIISKSSVGSPPVPVAVLLSSGKTTRPGERA